MNSSSTGGHQKKIRFQLQALAIFIAVVTGGCSQFEQRLTGFPEGPPVLADTSPEPRQIEPVVDPEIIEPPVPKDMLNRIAAEFSWDIKADSPQISYWTQYFQDQPEEFSIVLARGEPYLHFISEQIGSRELPMELALLPFVESGFDPRARSGSGAAGLWQFMPATGRSLGLEQNWWVDDRLSVVESTNSALEYLEYLNKRFDGDWLLALAAYNTGEGNVSNELRRSGSEADFWSLHLNAETRNYVPKLLAVVEVLRNSETYGIKLPEWEDSAYFSSLEVSRQLDMRKLESLSAEMRSLNSQYIQLVTYPQSGTTVLVPLTDRQRLQQELATRGDMLMAQYARYQVRNGDTLSVIADRHRVNLGALMSLNNISGHLIHPGDNLLIPISLASQPRVAQTQNDDYLRIKVRRGDSLSVIAERYGMRLAEIVALNQLSGNNPVIYPNQELLVHTPDAEGDPLLYRVANGDSLWIIANRFNIVLDDLLTWNGLHGREVIYPGQQLAIWTN